ncbi:hypothetical protein D5045_16965 [Verminephrobacter eiseniae]|nr:hypothetical protein [Verminephrobacter eiseniae]
MCELAPEGERRGKNAAQFRRTQLQQAMRTAAPEGVDDARGDTGDRSVDSAWRTLQINLARR